MYNEELKRKFIEECTGNKSNAQRAIRLFVASEGFEKEWGVDLCAASEEQLKPALERITGAKLGTQAVDMSTLRKYSKWCLENGVHGANENLQAIQDISYEKLRETMIESPEKLEEYLDKVFSPINDCRPDNLCRGYFWLAYMGFEEKELPEIYAQNVDLTHFVIRFNGKLYPIYKEAIPTILYLVSANSFLCDYVRYETVVERDHGTQILRGMRSGSGVNTESIGRLASHRLKDAADERKEKVVLRYKSIRYSGIFYRMLEEERKTGVVDPNKYLKFYFSNTEKLHVRRATRKSLELMTDYQRWKVAFNK